jgi:RNA polymerase sigma-70 factor, ECF subfamily
MSETIWIDRTMDGSVDEDNQLALAARQNPAEYRHIYNKWLPRIYKYFYFRVGNEKDAEDLTSQVFLKAYETLPRYQDKGCFSAWLFAIAHARVVDHYRRKRTEVSLDEAATLQTGQDLLARSARREEVDQVIRLLRTLTDDEQELIRLRFVAELSYVEIGAILNRREDAVRKATTRLLQRLQTLMEVDNE